MEWGRLNFQVGWFTILSIVRSSDHGIQHDFWFANGFQGHPKAPQRFFFPVATHQGPNHWTLEERLGSLETL